VAASLAFAQHALSTGGHRTASQYLYRDAFS